MHLSNYIIGIAVCSLLALPRQNLAEEMGLDEALERSFAAHPALKAAEVREAIGVEKEVFAGRLLNPTIGFEWENFGGDRNMSDGEYTLILDQELEMGGKRAARRGAAAAERGLSAAETGVLRRRLQRDVQQAYVQAWAAEQRVELIQKQLELLAAEMKQAELMLKSGRMPRRELLQKKAAFYEAETGLATARLTLAAKLLELSAFWKGQDESLDLQPPQLRSVAEIDLARHSRMKLLDAEYSSATAELNTVQAELKGNPSVAIGARYDADADEQSFLAAIAMPLPFFGRRSAATTAARMKVEAIDYDKEALKLELLADQRKLRVELAAAETALEGLREKVLPTLAESVKECETSYKAGLLSFTELNLLRRQKLENELRCIDLDLQRLELLTALDFASH